MQRIFLYGTLCHGPLLRVVLGRDAATISARLADHKVYWVEAEAFPILTAEVGAEAQGIVIEVTDDERARLDFYEGPFGYGLQPVEVETDTGQVPAAVYFPVPGAWEAGAPWSLADWVEDHGALVTQAAREVMAAFGVDSAEAVARRDGIIKSRAQAQLSTQSWQRPRAIGKRIGAEQVKITAQAYDHVGFFSLEDISFAHPRMEGGDPMEVRRAVFRAGEAVTVLPYDPKRDRVLMVEQFRAAPMSMGDPDPWLLEPVAGIRDAGESAETTARREAVEEAGVELHKLHFVSRYYPSPGGIAQVLYSYVGMADLPDGFQTSGGLAHEGEDIAIHVVDFADAMAALESGEIVVAPLIMSLQWLAANRARLRG